MKYPGFIGPSYTSKSKRAAIEECFNLYPEQVESPGGAAAYILAPTPGFQVLLTLPTSPVRGFHSMNGRTFAVAGDTLYELYLSNGVWSFQARGNGLQTLDGAGVRFATNGDAGHQVFITAGSKGYLYDLDANTLAFEIDAADRCAFLDGFFVALDASSSTVKISSLEDGSSWNALDAAQRSSAADRFSGMIVANKQLWLIGSLTLEVWYDSGSGAFPLVPNPSILINVGIQAPDSLALLNGSPVWLGQTDAGPGIVYHANGMNPERISTHAVEQAIASYSVTNDAKGWTYQENGHEFYVLTFPTVKATWVFDRATQLWHRRGDYAAGQYVASPVFGHTYAFGTHLTGDATSGNVYAMSSSYTVDGGGRLLRRMRRAPHLVNEGKRTIYDALQLDLDTGLGIPSGQGSNPQLMLRWSDDGGNSWSSEHWTSAGVGGAFGTRALWKKLGAGRDRVFEVTMTDPIPWRLVDAWLTLRAGQA